MSKLAKRLQFLADHSEYVSIEHWNDDYRVTLGGDEWQGVAEKCDGPTIRRAVREAVRTVERVDRKRMREAKVLR